MSMKNNIKIILSVFFLLFSAAVFGQNKTDSTQKDTVKLYKVVKNDGSVFFGKIISKDAHEVLIDTKAVGQVAIPKHEIKEITEVKKEDLSSTGELKGAELFSTRYFLTTNGFPIEKGESYVLWSIYGPDFEFAAAKNFSCGIMTSWLGMPAIGTAKYCIPLAKKLNMSVGILLGTGSWAKPDLAIGLPFASITYGERRINLTFSAGYGAVVYKETTYDPKSFNPSYNNVREGRLLLSAAGLIKVGKKASIVFDSFIMPVGPKRTTYQSNYDPNTGITTVSPVTAGQPGFAILIPGIRWEQEGSNKAFQFGFAGIMYDNEVQPFTFPMIQWFRKL